MLAKLAFRNVRASARDFAVYFFTLVLGVAVFYAFNSIAGSDAVAQIDEDGRAMMELLGTVIRGVSVFVAAVLAFLVMYANRFLIRRRNREFAIYLTLGMSKRELFAVSALETLIVGAASLIAGLAIGIAAAQALANAAAGMFSGETVDVRFSVSPDAMLLTAGAFAAIFAFTVVLNTGRLFKTRLIDLLASDRRNERQSLRSLPLSFFLFIVACIMIGASYKLLVDNGLLDLDAQFAGATALVCAGTVLFFYSLSGFLLRLAQLVRPLYLRGLNMFFLRQLSARVNSAFFSMSVVAIALFLAMTSVCGGIGICDAMEQSAERGTRYDASVSASYYGYDETGERQSLFGEEPLEFAAERGFDMAAGLADSAAAVGAPSWDSMVAGSAQIDFYESHLSFAQVGETSGVKLGDHVGAGVLADNADAQEFLLVGVSQFNAARELAGLSPVSVGEGECLVWNDFAATANYADALAGAGAVFDVGGRQLRALSRACSDTVETTSISQRAAMLVVPDDAIPAGEAPCYSLLDVACEPGQQSAFGTFAEAVQAAADAAVQPVSMVQTADAVRAQGRGLTAVVSYLAIYIGFVLVIACAAILAIQQLTDASDNVRRYELLAKLGAPRAMIDGALFKQILVYFAFPLALGVAHTLCAMQVVVDVVRIFGYFDIAQTSMVTVAAFLAVYGAYFAVTYFSARAMVRFRRG